MSGGPRVRSTNVADSKQRSVLVPAGNKAKVVDVRKPAVKSKTKPEKSPDVDAEDKKAQTSPPLSPSLRNFSLPSMLRQHGHQLLRSNLSMNASCSSEASSDSSHSRVSTGRISRKSAAIRGKQGAMKVVDKLVDSGTVEIVGDDGPVLGLRKRCAWVTPCTDPCYADFHDEEWGVPNHNDNKLFELLSLAGALAELPWPIILGKRNIFREIFLDFNPIAVSKLNEKKIAAPGSPCSSILSELKLRAIIENARRLCKVIDEFGSFDNYVWGFVNQKPVVSGFRYARQVPVKTPKADVISKDLVRRGFRSVGPTVVYSFMQAAGLTNDHLISCFRFRECIMAADGVEKVDGFKAKVEDKSAEFVAKLELPRALDEMSICSDT
ncbi:hypothetical protein Nepgr_017731 [Nepenthes gracilis]|uniref:DNA-3-methyladenine glycosylase I n=1 Tax=Nepenthes gracilis TaxID=150966 RepID=A0AAD3SPY3_NEPGR|nr:hypothetical protein Nepgr_017731 [Nepenthes gracilis]